MKKKLDEEISSNSIAIPSHETESKRTECPVIVDEVRQIPTEDVQTAPKVSTSTIGVQIDLKSSKSESRRAEMTPPTAVDNSLGTIIRSIASQTDPTNPKRDVKSSANSPILFAEEKGTSPILFSETQAYVPDTCGDLLPSDESLLPESTVSPTPLDSATVSGTVVQVSVACL